MLSFNCEYSLLQFSLIKTKPVLVDNDISKKSMNYTNDSWLPTLDTLALNSPSFL